MPLPSLAKRRPTPPSRCKKTLDNRWGGFANMVHMTNVTSMIKISMHEVGGSSVLSGGLRGQEAFAKLWRQTVPEPPSPTPIFLDFSGIEVATASFLRESVLAFRTMVRTQRPMFYPIIANINDAVREDLTELVTARGDTVMTCQLTEDDRIVTTTLIGTLDPKQQRTFDLVHERGETDAGTLMREFGKTEGVSHATAWNNRLSALAALGLIVEVSAGRAKRYRPLFHGA